MIHKNNFPKNEKRRSRKPKPSNKKIILLHLLLSHLGLAIGIFLSNLHNEKSAITQNEKQRNKLPQLVNPYEIAAFLNQHPQSIVLRKTLGFAQVRALYVLRWLFDQQNSFLLYVKLATNEASLSPTMFALLQAQNAYLSSEDVSPFINTLLPNSTECSYYEQVRTILVALTKFDEQLVQIIFESAIFLNNYPRQNKTFLRLELKEMTKIEDIVNELSLEEITIPRKVFVFLEVPVRFMFFSFAESFRKQVENDLFEPTRQHFEFNLDYFIATINSQEIAYFKKNNKWFKFNKGAVTEIKRFYSISNAHMLVFSIAKLNN